MAMLLLDCLQEYYLDTHEDLPDIPVANFCLIPGTEIAEDIDPIFGFDRCCEGLGWVRVADAYPSSDFPEPDLTTTKCFPVSWAQRYEVGILGCYPSTEHALTCTQKGNLALQDLARIEALKRVFCCFGEALKKSNPGRLFTIESITVQGPRGGCISRVASILVQVPRCC